MKSPKSLSVKNGQPTFKIFVVNGRPDKDFIIDELTPQLKDARIDYEIYKTTAEGDGTRFVRIYCDFHPNDEVCFVACGGTDTLSEVVNGVVGAKNKRVALLVYVRKARHWGLSSSISDSTS